MEKTTSQMERDLKYLESEVRAINKQVESLRETINKRKTEHPERFLAERLYSLMNDSDLGSWDHPTHAHARALYKIARLDANLGKGTAAYMVKCLEGSNGDENINEVYQYLRDKGLWE